MYFIKLTVKNPTVLHGFDENNKERLEKDESYKPTTKMISVNRIKSICKDLVLMDYADGRWIFWEYEEEFDDIVAQLESFSRFACSKSSGSYMDPATCISRVGFCCCGLGKDVSSSDVHFKVVRKS